jgi:hypothetical protein
MSKQDTTKEFNKVKDLLNKRGDEIKRKYSVHQMGIGHKTQNGKLTNKVALVFYVNKKKSRDEIISEGGIPIPEKIDGVLTDIVEVVGGFQSR